MIPHDDSPFHAACRERHLDVVNYLCDHGLTCDGLNPFDAQFLEELYACTDGDHWTVNTGWDERFTHPTGCYGASRFSICLRWLCLSLPTSRLTALFLSVPAALT